MNNSVLIRFTTQDGTQNFTIKKPVSDSIYIELSNQNKEFNTEKFKIDNLKIFGRNQGGIKYFDLNNSIDCDYIFNFDLLYMVHSNKNTQYNVTDEKQKLNQNQNISYKRSTDLLIGDNSKETIMLCAGASLTIPKNALQNGTVLNLSAVNMKNDGLGKSNVTSFDFTKSEKDETYNANKKNY